MTAPTWPPVRRSKSRLLIALVLDTSSSMASGDAVGQLNSALRDWREHLHADSHLRRIGEIAVVTFGAGGVRIIDPAGGDGPVSEPFVPVDRFDPPVLRAGGYSPMVAGIKLATRLIDQRRRALAAAGTQMAYQPLLYLLTDGAPSDERGQPCPLWRNLAPELRRQEERQELLFFAFGVRGADLEVLRLLAPDKHYQAEGTNFGQVLAAVRQSIERVMKNDGDPSDQAVKKMRAQQDVHDWIIQQTQQGR